MNIAGKANCPHCDAMIYVFENNMGRTVACAECGCLMQPERVQGGAIALHVMGQVLGGSKRRARSLVGLAVLLAVIACICSAFALVVATRDSRVTNEGAAAGFGGGADALALRVQRLEGELRHLHATIGTGVTSGSNSIDGSDVLNAPSVSTLSEPSRTDAENLLDQSRPASVKLLPPYQIRPGQPAERRISVQSAVALICSQAGVRYDWDTSFKNTDPACRRYITPRLEDVPLEEALTQLTHAAGLHYTIVDNTVVLVQPGKLSEPSKTYAKPVHDQSGAASVTLLPPYQVGPGQPAERRISVQSAVVLICAQAGVRYDWDTSFKNTDPACRRYITPRLEDVPFEEALTQLTQAGGLHYTIVDNTVVLVQPSK